MNIHMTGAFVSKCSNRARSLVGSSLSPNGKLCNAYPTARDNIQEVWMNSSINAKANGFIFIVVDLVLNANMDVGCSYLYQRIRK